MNIQQSNTSNRIIFWTIIITAIVIVILLSIISTTYQTLTERAQATQIAIPTLTAEAVEAIYQKGLAYINLGRKYSSGSSL